MLATWHRVLRETALPRSCRHPGHAGGASEHLMKLWVSLFIAGGCTDRL